MLWRPWPRLELSSVNSLVGNFHERIRDRGRVIKERNIRARRVRIVRFKPLDYSVFYSIRLSLFPLSYLAHSLETQAPARYSPAPIYNGSVYGHIVAFHMRNQHFAVWIPV